ncbi:MAG: CHAD domain-containing protein [Phycisphaerales bacterium]|nr:CHAD domain-containing protein [Phycisphaerales bacterium]
MPANKHKAAPARQRARQTTQARMLRVLAGLDGLLTTEATRADQTFIHDFRVASRRAHEVLHVGMLALAPSQRKAVRHVVKRLRRLRRAAGRVRDLDVLAANLTKLSTTQEPTPMTGHNALRQRVLHRLCKEIHSFAAEAQLKQIAGQILQTQEIVLIAKLNARIERNHRSFTTLATAALAKPTDRHTHKLRIAGKRLRYALELLPRHTSQRTATVQSLKDLQDVLGQRHDLEILRQHLQHMNRTRPLTGVGLWQNQWKQLMHKTDNRIESLVQSFAANPSLRKLMTSSAMHI